MEKRAKNAHVFERDGLDWYVEPEDAAFRLFNVERFSGRIWDPACGQGNIVRTAREGFGYPATGSDIKRRVPEQTAWFTGEHDFLKLPFEIGGLDRHALNIVSNPPFYRAAGAENFIRRALVLATGKVAMFLNIKFLAGGKRGRGLWKDHPPHRVWIHSDRPSCPPGEYLLAGGKAEGDTQDWIWVVWDLTAPPVTGPQLGWLR